MKGVIADYNEWRDRVIAENREAAAKQMAELEKKALRSKYAKIEVCLKHIYEKTL